MNEALVIVSFSSTGTKFRYCMAVALQVCDAVVVARLVNAALVLPLLDNTSWWADGR